MHGQPHIRIKGSLNLAVKTVGAPPDVGREDLPVTSRRGTVWAVPLSPLIVTQQSILLCQSSQRNEVAVSLIVFFTKWFSFWPHNVPGVDSASLREMSARDISWVVQGDRCLGLKNLPPSCADCLEMCEPRPPGKFRTCPDLHRKRFTFFAIKFLVLNLQTLNVNYRFRTAPLTSKVAFYIFIQQIQVPNILNMVYTLRFFLFKMQFVS